MPLTSLEICAGAGGMALGIEQAGFKHEALVELDGDACETLRANRGGGGTQWRIFREDVTTFDGAPFFGKIDLFAGGVPCPPFSVAGQQRGASDERNLFPHALRLIREIMPRAVMLENVPGFASKKFDAYRAELAAELATMGFETRLRVLRACDFGVAQLRPRCVLVAMSATDFAFFRWPEPLPTKPVTVGEALFDLMASRNLPWPGARAWADRACGVGPTLVGGSKKHGGADLGPSRARAAWEALGVTATSLTDDAPPFTFPIDGHPRLTLAMVKRLQGFPDSWKITGQKTQAYRQIGNAFPPPVACAVASEIRRVFTRDWKG